jgi:outer membrane protein OmpA-like peptidoglycan-associated protein/predicted  nucleic acid-binding Zn-ribbon protein
MTCRDSRAQRFAKAWLGPSLATILGIGSTVELAAMPLAPTGPQLPGSILIQQSTEPQSYAQQPPRPSSGPARGQTAPDSFTELHEALAAARERLEELSRAAEAVAATGDLQRELAALQERNQQLQAEVAAVRAERAGIETAKQAAETRAAELTEAAEQAKAKAQEMDQELVAMRWQNAQLNTSLAQARTTRDQMEAETRQAQNALRARIEQLEADAKQTAAGTVRLRGQLEASEQRIAAAGSARAEAEGQLSEMRERLQRAEQEGARLGEDRARIEAELATAKEQLAAAEQARTQGGQRTATLADERDQLRDQLAAVTGRLEHAQAANGQLEREMAELREAASAATEVARQNLVAVETRIRELNEALAMIGPAGGPIEADPALLAEPGAPAAGEPPDVEAPASMAPVQNVAAAPTSQAPELGGADGDLARIKAASATNRLDGGTAPAMLADLPLEKRLHVQGLLADLGSHLDDEGLITTVPGELLFAVNSDEVQDGAHDTLAKVAELISVYDDRQVLIIGHSDAVGDAAYNKQLSERRAGLVKQFFVDNFEVEGDRLSTQGWGESRPIASNTTLDGRRANRRVEVLILN